MDPDRRSVADELLAAGELLRASGDGEWGFVFLDAERPAYAGYWPDLVRVIAPAVLPVVKGHR